jgi:hypothetical protein
MPRRIRQKMPKLRYANHANPTDAHAISPRYERAIRQCTRQSRVRQDRV